MKTNRTQGRAPAPRLLVAALAVAFAQALPAWALPDGADVVLGGVAIARPDAQNMVIRQSTDKAIVNWQGFSIGQNEGVRIQQPGAGSAILNRVTGASRSDIHGRLEANGKVFLVNPNGVVFGKTATVNVGSIVASTLAIENADFAAGRHRFKAEGSAPAAVTNAGRITAAERGTVALMGGRVANDGTISAQLGTVALAAGEEMTLDLAGDGLSRLTITRGTLEALVENGGAAVADGGQVLLSARALAEVSSRVVNQTGVVRARGLSERGGRIVLDGGESGVTEVSGVLDASAPQAGGRGGEVQVLGHHVAVSGTAALDASGAAGGGAVLVGGDYQGRNPAVRNATATYVGPRASVKADATVAGAGGKVVAWSDEATRAHGSFSARGGPTGGDGGLVETSGAFLDVSGARVSATAPVGKVGQWLLDPTDLRIVPGDANENIDEEEGPVFVPVDSPASIGDIILSNALNEGTSVVVRTGAADAEGEAGDITMERETEEGPAPAIRYTGEGRVSLTLQAHRDIRIEPGARIEAVGAGSLDVDLSADMADANPGRVDIAGARIVTNGGAFRIYGQGNADSGYASGREDEVDLAGVRIADSTIDTGSGDISIRGSGEGGLQGVRLQGVIGESGAYSNTIEAPGGTVRIFGVGGIGGAGVQSLSTSILGGRGVLIDGTSAADDGVYLLQSRVEATLSAVNIIGLGEGNQVVSHGVNVLDSTISGFAGVDLRGESTHDDDGVKLERSVIESKAGSVGIFGKSSLAYGVYVPASSEQSREGNSEIFGASGVEIRGESGDDDAVNLYRTSIASGGGDVTIAGWSGSRIGVRISYGSLGAEETTVRSGTGRLEITGDTNATSGPGLALGNVVLGGGEQPQLGDIVLRARNGGAADSIELHYFDDGITRPASIRTTGSLVLVPGGLDGIERERADSVPIGMGTNTGNGFEIEPRDLAAVTSVASVVVGSDTHTGQISTAASSIALDANLTLQNEGDGSSGISFDGLDVAGHTLILASAGPLVQTTGGPIVADAFLVRATRAAAVDLTEYSNSVGTLAVDPPDSFAFLNDGPVVIGAVSGSGFSTTSGTVQVLAAADSSSFGDFFVRTLSGTLTLAQSVTTLDPGSNITLVSAGNFRNEGGGLVPGVGGRWRIWAGTRDGEERGGLVPDATAPSYYGCTFEPLACAAGITLPADGNRFIYPDRPTLTMIADDKSRLYGSANPDFTYKISPPGLLAGDTEAGALSGVLGTDAVPGSPVDPGSPVESYRIDNSSGGLISPVGYLLTVTAGTLTIDPATLLITVAPVSRLYGAANPSFTGAVSGFVAGDTLATATSGMLAFSTLATERSPVGSYAVSAFGLSADNYLILPADSNATALSIERATLFYIANPVSRPFGVANPALSGTVRGFVAGDTLETAVSGTLMFTTDAGPLTPSGAYAIDGEGLVAANYRLEQAAGNATALTIFPVDTGSERSALLRPTEDSSRVYERNFGLPPMCFATGPLVGLASAQGSDLLALEWSRVRSRPNLSNCVGVDERNPCSDF